MTNKEKKNIALHPGTYRRLSTLAAQMRIDNGGKFVSMSAAVGWLLDRRFESEEKRLIEKIAALDTGITEANDPQYLKPENEME
jgi:hypothetical protein